MWCTKRGQAQLQNAFSALNKLVYVFFVVQSIFLCIKVGVAAVQLARSHGMRVFGSAGSAAGCAVVKEAGAHDVFNHKIDGYLEKVMVCSAIQSLAL